MPSTPASRRDILLQFLVLGLLLLTAGYFRFTGLMWGDYQYPHPDERFLVWVVADIAPVENLDAYFDTAASTLNPANRGHTFFVYGDFPVILTRYVAEWAFDAVGWQEVIQVGRGLSAFLDLLTVLLVYAIGLRVAGWKVGALGGLFSAAAVLQIQQAHFFTSDSFAVFFTTLAIYLGVRIITEPDERPGRAILWLSLLYGAAVGMAMACKINTAPVAVLLPLALGFRWLRRPAGERLNAALRLAAYAAAGGFVALLVFRVAMPYAFEGPGFFNVALDPRWLASMENLSAQSSGDVDFPPALQWARRNHLFSLQNLALWGLGLPLAALAWTGFFVLAWRVIQRLAGREEDTAALEAAPETAVGWRSVIDPALAGALLVWIWTGAYFLWQSMSWNPTMRYQLPIYPTLCFLAAWGAGSLWARANRRGRFATAAAAGLVLVLTLSWAFAFTCIYTRPETRVDASRWILENVPAAVNLKGVSGEAQTPWRQMLPISGQVRVSPGQPYQVWFVNGQAARPSVLALPALRVVSLGSGGTRLQATISDPTQPGTARWAGEADLFGADNFEKLDLPMSGDQPLEAGRRYLLTVSVVGSTEPAQVGDERMLTVFMDGEISLNLYERAQVVEYVTASGSVDGAVGGAEDTPGQAGDVLALTLPEGGTLRQVRVSGSMPIYGASVILTDAVTGEQNMSLAAPVPYSAPAGEPPVLRIEPPLVIEPGVKKLLIVTSAIPGQPLEPGQTLLLDVLDAPAVQMMPASTQLARGEDPLWVIFNAGAPALLQEVTLAHAAQVDPVVGSTAARLALFSGRDPSQPLAMASAQIAPPQGSDPRGGPVTFVFDRPVSLTENESYSFSLTPDAGALAVRGSAPANETSWDMSLPFRMEGYDPYGGLYRNDLNFEMYWDDTADKRSRFVNILDQADYIFISSNRQWGTTTRIPERYPLTTAYYRALMGCPVQQDLLDCYNTAEVGDDQGRLGYDLVHVVTSYPNLGPLRFNTQYAEEAFTVYDHPKVFIFKKGADYDPLAVREILGAVDLDSVVHLTPRKAAAWKDLLLPAQMWAAQQGGGSWAQLFPPGGLLNRYPALAAVVWYLFLMLLGLVIYPVLRLALPGLPDRGYPLARTAGLVVLAFLGWAAGSLGVPVTRLLLVGVFAAMAIFGLWLGWLQRAELRAGWREQRSYVLRVEAAALGLFVLFLLVRLGNPDLWHPIFGGEKPMDFSYFNAVLKSSLFPPYDPWFAGGYINYYYYGFVLVGMPVKLLGIDPTVAYNLILPGLFMLVGLGAWSVGANLYAAGEQRRPPADVPDVAQDAQAQVAEILAPSMGMRRGAALAGLVAVLALLILGNQGTVRMYWRGLQKLVVPEETILGAGPVQQTGWVVQGLGRLARGEATELPYYSGDWYWKPSRAIQPESGSEITEFPAFTFLYADLHAHLMALPVTILVIGWGLGVMLGAGQWGLRNGRWRRLSFGLALLLGALAAGMLRPANTWDQYTYLALAALALFYGQAQAAPGLEGSRRTGPFTWLWSPWVSGLLAAAALVGLALLLYRPFDAWFAQGYNALEAWQGPKTGLSSYLVHWGLFLFVITGWLVEETVDWMAATPLSSLGRLRSSAHWFAALGLALAAGVIGLVLAGVHIALIAGPLGVWVTVLLLRPGRPAARRAVLFMTGAALALTLGVELVAVKGDIGRMNTVFKFYYQAWTLFSLSAAAGLAWLWPRLARWIPPARTVWLAGFGLLVFGAALFPLAAGRAKITDRMIPTAPHTLDGMEFMNHATYRDGLTEEGSGDMDLSQDYRAIRWMQANVPGSPVIVEANTPEYRHWGTRFTIYTGLPGVIGWNWHQRQQRTVTPDTWVYDRIQAVSDFYTTTSPEQAAAFLERYNVGYIVLGQLERLWYAGSGLEKFEQLNGVLWDKVYEEGPTVIYRTRN